MKCNARGAVMDGGYALRSDNFSPPRTYGAEPRDLVSSEIDCAVTMRVEGIQRCRIQHSRLRLPDVIHWYGEGRYEEEGKGEEGEGEGEARISETLPIAFSILRFR